MDTVVPNNLARVVFVTVRVVSDIEVVPLLVPGNMVDIVLVAMCSLVVTIVLASKSVGVPYTMGRFHLVLLHMAAAWAVHEGHRAPPGY